MPILNVKLAVPRSKDTSAKIAAALTDLTVGILRKKREVTAVAIEYLEPDNWFIGGVDLAHLSQATFFLDIKVTEGTNTKDEKAQYISKVYSAAEQILGPLATASYIVIHDVRGDAWGFQGQTQEYRYIYGKSL